MGQGFDLGSKPKMDATPITPSPQVGNKPRKLLFITMNVLSSQVDGDFDLVKKLRGGTLLVKVQYNSRGLSWT